MSAVPLELGYLTFCEQREKVGFPSAVSARPRDRLDQRGIAP
jgi:hypothetical protein